MAEGRSACSRHPHVPETHDMDDGDSTRTTPEVVREHAAARAVVQRARKGNHTLGLVPTMGALHQGHLSLVRKSVEQCDVTIVTIVSGASQ